MPTLILYGSSYIERLRRHCDGDLCISGVNTVFFGRGGLRTDRMDQRFVRQAIATGAEFAFLHVGGNDISPTSTPREIFERIVELVFTFNNAGMKKVWVAEIITRGNFSKVPGLTKEAYECQRIRINQLLHKKFGKHFVQFKDIKYPTDYLQDLVHLQTSELITVNTGIKKYMSRIRRIIASTQKH
ncbi:hypothetical protein KP79_PYT10423 [Mizuhopecten yessoensis]|uniref:SGNH hydrolase-type esterase domain-containing protein n=2 Tax=Mizuhopecten yessoensis TaxID=6573 RepID=A0A210PMC2_MIZYE|nr:hypothetical protein KP79_PYT10423 [Mizuhopecten yessoensis]